MSGINRVSSFFANLLGVEEKQFALIEYQADYSGFKKSGQEAIENFSMDDLKKSLCLISTKTQTKIYLSSLTTAKPDTMLPFRKPPQPRPCLPCQRQQSRQPAGGSIDSIGKVDNSVDVASEDLKVMRDLAEVNAISNMITLTPTVQMTTGTLTPGPIWIRSCRELTGRWRSSLCPVPRGCICNMSDYGFF